MKWFTTLHSLHQHVWHIERISMTTLTFDEGTENCFESMESTDPSWVLRCKVKIYYMALKSFFLKYRSVSKAISGETQKHMDSRANLTVFVLHWSTTKENEKELVPSALTCPDLQPSHSEIMNRT